MIVKGKNRDTAWYSIIDQDWPEIREIFREWLGEENFDQDDVASQSLSTLMQNRKV